MLSYLVNASLKNETPKAISIALDVFQKDKDFESVNESSTRVYIQRLREKLNKYYKDEGKKDKVRITISKGQYGVKFIKRSFEISKVYRYIYPIIIFFMLMVIILLFSKLNLLEKEAGNIVQSSYYQNDPIWSDLFSSDLSTTIVLGEETMYEEIIEGQYDDLILVKNFQVNNIKKLRIILLSLFYSTHKKR